MLILVLALTLASVCVATEEPAFTDLQAKLESMQIKAPAAVCDAMRLLGLEFGAGRKR